VRPARFRVAYAVVFLTTLAIAGCESRPRQETAARQKAIAREPDSAARQNTVAPEPGSAAITRGPRIVGPALVQPPAPLPAVGKATRTVRVVLTEWQIKLSPDTVPSGHITFRIVNRGKEPHSIEVEPLSGDDEFEREGEEIEPGQRGMVTYDLPVGTWSVDCPLSSPSANGGHTRRGMQATLVVR
jgi:hypothetical protein